MRLLAATLLSMALLVALPASGATLAVPPPLLYQQIEKVDGSVVQSFPAPDGLTGWVVKIQGRYGVVYTTASGDYILSGALIDKDGQNLSADYLDKYAPKPDAAALATALASDPWLVDEGSPSAPLIYVYLDSNCSYCNKLWTEIRPYVESGKVHVRWVLLSFLKTTSKGRGAAILAANNRAAALAQNETRFNHQEEEGGIPELSPVPIEIGAALETHTKQMNDAGDVGTPMLVIHRKDGWSLAYGAPQDLPALIASLTR